MGASSSFLLLSLSLYLSFSLYAPMEETTFRVIDHENPVLNFIPSASAGYSNVAGAKQNVPCDRIQVRGSSRFKIKSYANSFRVTLTPSVVIPERLHSKIKVCLHRNATVSLCQCGKDNWKTIQNGQWSAVMSPYVDQYVDLMFTDGVYSSVTVSVEEEYHQWRLVCLAFGFVLLLLAPTLSTCVPFYYSSSMAIGVLLVILILLFQGMKLLPTGRKSALYFTIYGSVIGVGSFILHYLSMMVNSVRLNLGLSEDMYNPVSVFLLLGVILLGGALGYWIMRRYIISDDGRVDVGVAQFVMWAMRIIAVTFIFQSTFDTPLAVTAVACCWGICFSITSPRWLGSKTGNQLKLMNGSPRQKKANKATADQNCTELLHRSPPQLLYGLAPFYRREEHYYSTFHKTPNRKRFSKQEWEDFTSESTREAMVGLTSSPEFADWVVHNHDRMKIDDYISHDDSIGSEDNSLDEIVVDSSSKLGFLNWCCKVLQDIGKMLQVVARCCKVLEDVTGHCKAIVNCYKRLQNWCKVVVKFYQGVAKVLQGTAKLSGVED